MAQKRKVQVPVKLELSGGFLDSISRIASDAADFIEVLFFSLTEIVLALTDVVVRHLQRH